MTSELRGRTRFLPWILAPLMFAAIGCNTDLPVVPPINTKSLQVVSNVEGDLLASDAFATSGSNFYSVLGNATQGSSSVAINIVVPIRNVVPYTVDVASDPVALIGYNLSGKGQFTAQQNVGSGTITITQTSPSLIGSFHGTVWLTPASGSDTIRVLTDGQFNAPF